MYNAQLVSALHMIVSALHMIVTMYVLLPTLYSVGSNIGSYKYNGSLTADIMVAFSGCSPDDWVDGIAETANPYAAVFDSGYNGYDGNAQIAQHELGHTYGLKHENCSDIECVMNGC